MKNGFKKGLTVIELLVAIYIISIGLLGAFQAFSLGGKIANHSQMATIASELVQEKIEEKISESYDNLLIATTTEDYASINSFQAFKRITEVVCVHSSDLYEVACNYDAINNPDPSKKIEVSVYWKSSLGLSEKNIKAVTVLSKR